MAGRTKHFPTVLIVIAVLIVVAIGVSVSVGAVGVSADTVGKVIGNHIFGKEIFPVVWERKTENIIWNIRFPRVVMAFLVGAGLAVCGVLMQALTKNPLADPYVLGISSGASAGAVSEIVLGVFSFLGGYSVMAGATIGAAASIFLSLQIASVRGRITSTRLVLAGIATSALFSAITNMIVYGAHTGSDKTKTALYWMVGSLSGATWSKAQYLAIVFVIVVGIILLFTRELDALLLGDDAAENLGVEVQKVRWMIILASTVLTGAVVSVSGVIGFVGLVVPHILRGFIGSRHRELIPAVVLAGGLFAILADLISRVLIAPEELPVGVVAAFFGAPFFLYLIRRDNARQ